MGLFSDRRGAPSREAPSLDALSKEDNDLLNALSRIGVHLSTPIRQWQTQILVLRDHNGGKDDEIAAVIFKRANLLGDADKRMREVCEVTSNNTPQLSIEDFILLTDIVEAGVNHLEKLKALRERVEAASLASKIDKGNGS